MLVIFTAATALVVGLVAALATDNWIFLPVAIGIHVIGTVLVLMAIRPRLQDEDKPDPVTEARLEEKATR
jgi:membrane protein implicated in regulation of membrane protease activity